MAKYDFTENLKEGVKRIKYFLLFEGEQIQPSNIQRISTEEAVNLNGIDGDGDGLIYRIVLSMVDYPFRMEFDFATAARREAAQLELNEKLRDNKVQIEDDL